MQIHARKTAINDWIAPLTSNLGSAPDAQNVRRRGRQIYEGAQLGRIRCSESPGVHQQNFLCQAQHLPQWLAHSVNKLLFLAYSERL
ncbi:hypothetical protein [Thiobacillus denitrificans]|uniref:hypothetical protein n=1 Tax=Thiobacillus denitrificans TaxID=36861 RepID=UPI0012FC3248|nr:hypothetical protein [Thiobacillus denitrificans]